MVSLANLTPDRVANALGWLAPWWMKPDALQEVARKQFAYQCYLRDRPSLPSCPGGCWAVFVLSKEFAGQHLRPAVVLPMVWGRGDHDPALPPSLREEAERVRDQFGQGEAWGLWLAKPDDEGSVSLTDFGIETLGASSAWAALAGGLVLARDGLSPRTDLWITAAHHPTFGVGAIDGLPEKADLAADWGAKEMFVPAQNLEEVGRWQQANPGRTLKFVPLTPAQGFGDKPSRVLAPYLERLGTEPSADASFDVLKAYYFRVDHTKSQLFAWERLRDVVVERCAEKLPEEFQPSHVITVVSMERTAVAQAAAAIAHRRKANQGQPLRCLFLHDGSPAVTEVKNDVVSYLTQRGVDCQEDVIQGDSISKLCDQAKQAISKFTRDVLPERIAADMTPGFKNYSLALLDAVPSRVWLMYCLHKQGADKRVVPGSQRYDCWRKGD